MDTVLKSNLEKFITKEKVNVTNISKRTGISVSTLCRILSGEIKNPSSSTIEQLSMVFKIPVNKLINEEIIINEEENINHKSIKDRLQYLMKKSRVNIDTLVGMTNLSHGAIRSIMLGETKKPNLETCTKLADFFSITVKQLKCEENLDLEEDLYKDIPIININNIKNWITTNNDKFIDSFKSFLLKSKKKSFAMEISNDDYIFEFEIGDLLIFEETNELGIGKFAAEINNIPNLYQIYSNEKLIKYRLIGSTNKMTTEIENVSIYGKLLEVKVNN